MTKRLFYVRCKVLEFPGCYGAINIGTPVYAETAGKAKYQRWLEIVDAWQDIKITDMSAVVGCPLPDAEKDG